MPQLTIGRLASGGVITNYDCVSKCGHCLYNCGPHRSEDYLDEACAETIFNRIAALGCRSVHIGGGEPLRQPEKLAAVLETARRVGMGIDYVETSSAWFRDEAQAAAILECLRDADLSTLLVSISPFHNARIAFANVQGVIAACRRAGIQVFPWVNAFVRDLDRLGADRPHAMAEFEAAYGQDYLRRIPDRYWIHLGGRALETFRPVLPSHDRDSVLARSPANCARALKDTSHFHIDLYGGYVPGLCAGLAVAMEDLGRPLPAGKYPLLDVLTSSGIRGLYTMAREDYGYRPLRESYLNHCDLCTEIRRSLIQLAKGQFSELAPEGFYA
jgi:hypothetical protein